MAFNVWIWEEVQTATRALRYRNPFYTIAVMPTQDAHRIRLKFQPIQWLGG